MESAGPVETKKAPDTKAPAALQAPELQQTDASKAPPPPSAKDQDASLRKVLSTLTADLAALKPGDKEGCAKVLDRAYNQLGPSAREDVRAALFVLKEELGQHFDYVPLVLTQVKTDHFDHAKASLKTAAKEIARCLAPEKLSRTDYGQALREVHEEVVKSLQSYTGELDKAAANLDATITKAMSMPEAQAVEWLCGFAATEQAQAEDWLALLRDPATQAGARAQIKEALHDRRESTADMLKDAQDDLRSLPRDPPTDEGRELLLKTVTKYSGMLEATLAGFGLADVQWLPPDGDPPAALSPEAKALWAKAESMEHWATGRQVGFFVGSFVLSKVPIVGAVTGAVMTGVDIVQARNAAEGARVLAGAGLMSRAQAERLDDQVTVAYIFGGINTLLMSVGIGAMKVPKGHIIKAVGEQLAKHRHLVAGLLGALGTAVSPETHAALENGDFEAVAQALMWNVAKSMIVSKTSDVKLIKLGFLRKGVDVPKEQAKARSTGEQNFDRTGKAKANANTKAAPENAHESSSSSATVRGKASASPPPNAPIAVKSPQDLATIIKDNPGLEIAVPNPQGGMLTQAVKSFDPKTGVIETITGTKFRIQATHVFRGRTGDEIHLKEFKFDVLQTKGGRGPRFKYDTEV
ncbi:MAG: hypothetical protein IT381_16550 [Deltaproteobacteria bacterium]|nr:hypothetical protein [Deltaproteobacteria bacterium]